MPRLPHVFHRVRLELAREPGHPSGSHQYGYEFVVPLTDAGRIDLKLWKTHRDECRVIRFRPDDKDVGHLVHEPGGSWAFHYDVSGDEDDEAGYRFGDEQFVVGEYVGITGEGKTHTFQVTSVEHL